MVKTWFGGRISITEWLLRCWGKEVFVENQRRMEVAVEEV